jgi:hypothetical protein
MTRNTDTAPAHSAVKAGVSPSLAERGGSDLPAPTLTQFDLPAFIEFVGSKPAALPYNWADATACALDQFGVVVGDRSDGSLKGVPIEVYEAAVIQSPATFGALAERLEGLSL